MGQPTKCTPERQKILLQYIRDGHYIATACDAAGIDRHTYSNWRNKADIGEEPYAAFFAQIKKADAEFLNEIHQIVLAAARKETPQTWPAAMTLAERTHRDLYGQQAQNTNAIEQLTELFKAWKAVKDTPDTRELPVLETKLLPPA